MTMAILSPERRSTRGLAPVLSMISRFWIKVESLKRPPTLLTMPSSFSSSCMVSDTFSSCGSGTPGGEMLAHQGVKLSDGALQDVVDDHMLVLAKAVELQPGRRHAAGDALLGLPALAEALLVQLLAGQGDEDGQVIGVERPHLGRP